MQPGLYRAHGEAKYLGSFHLGEAFEHAQGHDVAVLRAQMAECLHRVTVIDELIRAGNRLDWRHLREKIPVSARGTRHISRRVRSGHQQPWQQRTVDEPHGGAPAPRFEERDADDVLRILGPRYQREAVTVHAMMMTVEDARKRFAVSVEGEAPFGVVAFRDAHTCYVRQETNRSPFRPWKTCVSDVRQHDDNSVFSGTGRIVTPR